MCSGFIFLMAVSLLSESRIVADDTDFADSHSVTSNYLLRGQFLLGCYACEGVSSAAKSSGSLNLCSCRSKLTGLYMHVERMRAFRINGSRFLNGDFSVGCWRLIRLPQDK